MSISPELCRGFHHVPSAKIDIISETAKFWSREKKFFWEHGNIRKAAITWRFTKKVVYLQHDYCNNLLIK